MNKSSEPRALHQKAAVVTGASRGVGRAIALELAAAGADVLIHARADREAAEEVAHQITSLGRRTGVVLADLVDPERHETLVDEAWKWAGEVDIWVNNAGGDVLTGAKANWCFDDKLDYLWKIDVKGTIRLSRLAGRRMVACSTISPSRCILNMSWDQVEFGMGGDSGELFAAVKGAVAAYTKSLARSLAPQVRVNCLAPGWIRTAWGEEACEYWQHRAARESLLGRWGVPEDVARVACFLASPAAGFVTGQVVAINGGFRSSLE